MSKSLYDTPIAYLLRKLSIQNHLLFPEEHETYDVNTATQNWQRVADSTWESTNRNETKQSRDERSNSNTLPPPDVPAQQGATQQPILSLVARDVEKAKECYEIPESEDNIICVDWYGESDPENPLNWSKWKKFMVVFTINYSSAMVYMSASIYTVAQPEVSQLFGVSTTVASLGLVMFILGYGIGPMLFSPLSEIPAVGRNIPYVGALVIFVIISAPTALAESLESLLVLRFLQGLFGSPVLSTGGASLTDVCDKYQKPYFLYSWAIFSLAGPSLGTIIAGYSVPVLGWRWSLWEIIIAVGPGLVLCLFLPESSTPNILHRRAQRLNYLIKKNVFSSGVEMNLRHTSLAHRFSQTLLVPWKINALDPSILFTSLYMGLLYAVFYSFFEFFPLIYGNIYGMDTGQIGLMFLSVVISVLIAGIPYCAYVHFVVNSSLRVGKDVSPEDRLLPAVLSSVLIPTGLFILGWTSRKDIHWMVSIIGVGMVTAGVICILQCVFVYITLSYPQYTASLFSGNGLVRAVVASGGVLWSHPMYESLGIGWAMTLLGSCCAICVIGIIVLYKYGHILRAKSRFAS